VHAPIWHPATQFLIARNLLGSGAPLDSWLHPFHAPVKQTARELTNHFDGFLLNTNYLIMDRDTKFCESFRAFLSDEGVKPVQKPGSRFHET
jgi:hypothetical protein